MLTHQSKESGVQVIKKFAKSLDGLRMNATNTAENGVVGEDTIFVFKESGQFVSAEYSGGRVVQGYLVGVRTEAALTFRYCQFDSDGNLDGGESNCEIEVTGTGGLQIVENFEWASQTGSGKNVLEEIRSFD